MAIQRAVIAGEVIPAGDQYLAEVQDQLPVPIQRGYRWYNALHEREFRDDVEAFAIVSRRGLGQQAQLYQVKIHELVNQDQAEYTNALVRQATNYRGEIERKPQFTGKITFRSMIDRTLQSRMMLSGGSYQTTWVTRWERYDPLGIFSERIPLSALRVMNWIEDSGIRPDGWWVKKVEEVLEVTTVQPALYKDPWLIASFGAWGVIVAAWL